MTDEPTLAQALANSLDNTAADHLRKTSPGIAKDIDRRIARGQTPASIVTHYRAMVAALGKSAPNFLASVEAYAERAAK